MNKKPVLVMIALSFLLVSCIHTKNSTLKDVPSHVEIIKTNNKFQIEVNGEPFIVKGAGLSYTDGQGYDSLAQAGGNTFRTWGSDNADKVLALAKKNNLMVAMGLNVDKELHGFDYNDEAAVKKQFEAVKSVVQQYKNHPNMLVWVIANESNLLFNEDGGLKDVNPKVYDALSDIIDYIHEVDPHHPVTYTFAGMMKSHIDVALDRTPQVDFVSVQVYGDLVKVNSEIQALTRGKPFMVTEYGAIGHWEMPSTNWGREIEEPSGVKAAAMADRINTGLIENDTGLLIGSFAFLWGQKQERTPTWYGMFNADGKPNARIDEMTRIWTNAYPSNRAPLATDIKLNKKNADDSVYLQPNSQANIEVMVTDPDNDELRYEWVILKEVSVRSEGGAFEKKPDDVAFTQTAHKITTTGSSMTFITPEIEGDYRIFSYSYDGKGKVGNANFPFYIKAAVNN